MNPLVSIILVNYKQPKLTLQCIESICTHVISVSYEIIVVDNNSGKESIDLLAHHNDFNIIWLSENKGYGTANNIGVSQARGEYVWLLNNDTILKNDPFPFFIRALKSNASIGAIGAILHDSHMNYTRSGGDLYSIKKYLFIALNPYIGLHSRKEVNELQDYQEVGYVIGADLMMERSLFNELHGFDEHIFMYFEDVEMAYRMSLLGKKSVLIQGPQIIHLEGQSGTTMFQKIHNTASLMYCFKKRYSTIAFNLFRLTYFILKAPIILRNGKDEIKYVMSIWQYKHYLNNRI